MQTQVFSNSNFTWIDVVDPTPLELETLSKQYQLPANPVQDCLDPEHLPKFESFETLAFIILRAFDENSDVESDNVQELTRKLSVFYSKSFVITIHRKEQTYLAQTKEKWKNSAQSSAELSTLNLVSDLALAVSASFEKPIDQAIDLFEKYETSAFSDSPSSQGLSLKDGYFLKRRVSVFKRILRLSLDVMARANQNNILNFNSSKLQDVRENIESLYFYCDELLENVNNLITTHLSLTSNKVNEIMKVLTLFSMFFLPINFIASVYGMNFENIPELKLQYGYPMALGLMLFVALVIFSWFKKRGWMK